MGPSEAISQPEMSAALDVDVLADQHVGFAVQYDV